MAENADLHAVLAESGLNELFEADGAWLWDADLVNEVTTYQDGFWEQYGFVPARFEETFDFIRVVHTSDLREVTRAWRAHLEGETELYESEWRLLTAAGDWRWIRSRGKVVSRAADGTPLRMIGAYRDVTAEKAATDT